MTDQFLPEATTETFPCPRCGEPGFRADSEYCWSRSCQDYIHALRDEPAVEPIRERSDPLPDDRSEKVIEAAIIRDLEKLGWAVWKTSQPQRARGMTPGLADLFVAGYGVIAFLEVKRPDGVQSEAQQEFERMILANEGIYEIVRSEAEAVEWARQYMPDAAA